MVRFTLASLALTVVAACGDDGGSSPVDARPGVDAPEPIDAPQIDGAEPDAPPVADGIGEAKAAADGTGLTLPLHSVVVTYIKPQVGSTTNDPAGFTVQRTKTGPGLFVSVDPATLTPPLAVGDVVSFTVTQVGTVGGQKRAQALDALARESQGFDVATLSTDVSAATDLVTAIDTYDSRLVDVSGTVFEAFAASGGGFQRAGINTAGITGDTNLQLRAPTTLVDSLDLANTCNVKLHRVPVGRFNDQFQIPAFSDGDITLTACPAPTIVSATALSATSVRFTFSRNIATASVHTNGSDFTFDHGLTASAATVAGRTVTVTTSTQTGDTTYAATVATTITDKQGSALADGAETFTGFSTPAMVRINEVNANIGSSCDLIELRVIADGSMGGFTLKERGGGTNELDFTFPAGFNVHKNDFIVVHTLGTAATCNPGNATQEITTTTDQPVATFTHNFDNAFDFWANDNGLFNTDNVLTLFDTQGTIIDALFASDDPAGPTAAGGTETAAALVGDANQWDPALAAYVDTVFRTNAADDLNATGTDQAGTSIQRVNNNDTNGKADWTTGAGATSTWGALNPGQSAL